MSAQLKEVTKDGTLAANFDASGRRGIDPRRRRFGFNPGIYHAMLEPRESGRQEILLPVGLVSFRTTEMANDDFDNALKNGHNPRSQMRQIREDYTAEYFLNNFLIRYSELGGRELASLTLMDDPLPNQHGNVTKEIFNKSAQGYFTALFPAFDEIGHVCPAELKECVTCRLELLGDADEGRPMHPAIAERVEKLDDQEKAEELRAEIVAAEKVYLNDCEARWGTIIGEIADRRNGAPGIAKLGPGEHHVRRNLHTVEPSEAATAAGFGMEVAQANAEGMKELAAAFRERGEGGDDGKLLAVIAQMQQDHAAAQARTDAILEQLAKSVAKPEPAE